MKEINKLSQAVRLALFAGLISTPSMVFAADANDEAIEEEVEKITVTGSRIKRSEMEGPAPILSITAADLKDKGFNTTFEAVQSLSSATGSNQGQAFGGFTANAETANFRGLGPNRTLVLLNGKRVANYPRAYNGQNNVFNLASIPFAAVERFDIITGGSSAIYGSDAIAGVLNIITKRGVDVNTFTADFSTTDEGGGNNKRLSFVTGGESESFSWTMAVDYLDQDMLKGNERDWMDDRFDRPGNVSDFPEYASVLSRSLMGMQWNGGWGYIDPGQEVCDQFDNLEHANRPSRGNYCGRDNTGSTSLINARENASIYLTGTYEYADDHQVTADVLYWNSDSASHGSQFWNTNFLRDEITEGSNYLGSGYFYSPADGSYNYLQRTWQEQEMFGKGNTTNYEEQMLTTTLSFTGTVLDEYDYEVYASHSLSKDEQSGYRVKLEAGSDYFVDYDAETDVNTVNWDRFWQPLDEDGFNEIFGLNNSKSDSSVTTVGASITGDLFEMPAGPLAFSAFVEYEKSEYDINVNPRTLKKEGQGWAGLTGTEGSGDRARTAVALEFSVPVTEQVQANIALRYDNYNDDTDVGGAATYQLGLEYRPVDSLLLRANYGTTFRAPDLHNVFKDPSGSYSTLTDYTLVDSCNALAAGDTSGILIPGADIASLTTTCTDDFTEDYSFFGVQAGERKLKEEEGESLTVGFVWEPMDDLSMTFDLYRIKMEDAVRSYPNDRIMRTERDCLAGDEDPNSQLCVNTMARIDRFGSTGFNTSYKVDEVRSSFINAAMREQTGFDYTLNYSYELDGYGELALSVQYSHVLKTENQWFTGDEIDEDYRDSYVNDEFRSKVVSLLSYTNGDWRVTVEQHRFGSMNNDVEADDWTQVEEKRYKPWFNYNLGVNYSITDDQSVRLGVINVRNSRARYDASEGGNTGGFNIFAYPATTIILGRQFTLNYQVTF